MFENIKLFLGWLFSTEAEEKPKSDPTDILLDSIILTARARFNAANRLEFYSAVSFITNLFMSLGLILIPLLQLANMHTLLPQNFINAILIFLAITVLVYSLVSHAEKYEVRAQKLTECGNSMKDLIREIRAKRGNQSFDLDHYNIKYGGIIKDSENHNRFDYTRAKIESKNMFHITGIKGLWLHVLSKLVFIPRLVISIALLGAESFLLLKAFFL